MKNNNRNQYGVKDSSETYLTIGGVLYTQWADVAYDEKGNPFTIETKEQAKKEKVECKKKFPKLNFIIRKQKEGFYRVYYDKTTYEK